MNLRRVIIAIVLFAASVSQSNAQSHIEAYQRAIFLMNDSSVQSAKVDVKLLVTTNTLAFVEAVRNISLKKVRTVTIDSVTYFVKRITNMSDSIKIVERVIEGKISLYVSPKISTRSEMFAEKGETMYELRRLKRNTYGMAHEIREYASYLKLMSLDCPAIDPEEVEKKLVFSLSAFKKLAGKYNQNCGWQVNTNAIVKPWLVPAVTFGVVAGFLSTNNQFNYDNRTGKSSLPGFFAGPSVSLDFRKFQTVRVTYDLLLEKISGEAKTTPRQDRHVHTHAFNILQLKQIIAAEIALYSRSKTSVFLGVGTLLQHKLANNTTLTENRATYTGVPDVQSSKDNFNAALAAHIKFRYKQFGFRYQFANHAVQMKVTQKYGLEHRFSFHYDFAR
jgi:hypothetical protein